MEGGRGEGGITASMMMSTLSFRVGREGSMPRKERKDLPDWGDMAISLMFLIVYIV